MESRKLSMQVMQKVPTKSCFYITCLSIFMQNILPIIRHIFLSFLSYCSNSTSSSSWAILFFKSIWSILFSKISSFPDSLFEGDTLYVLDVIFFKIIDRLLMIFSLLTSSFFSMWIVSWRHSINISDSLLAFVSLLLDLTGHIYVTFRSCVSNDCSKEPIPWLSKKIYAS